MADSGSQRRPLRIVAEGAQGYEGKPVLGELLIRGAAASGADAIKFQMVFAEDVAVPGYRYYPWYKQLEMADEEWASLKEAAHRSGLAFYADLSGERALRLARRVMPDAAKIHSGNFFNHRLVEEVLDVFPWVLVSTGGISVEEIERFVRRHRLERKPGHVGFLFGFQAEPTPLGENHLARLPAFISRLDGFEVGFMDHTDGGGEDVIYASAMAQALGVRLFEKHITLDRSLRIEDYASALAPSGFAEYVRTLRRLDAALGAAALALSAPERAYRAKMLKKLLAARDLPAGHVLAEADIVQKRVELDGESFCYDPDLVCGRRLARPVEGGRPLRGEDLA